MLVRQTHPQPAAVRPMTSGRIPQHLEHISVSSEFVGLTGTPQYGTPHALIPLSSSVNSFIDPQVIPRERQTITSNNPVPGPPSILEGLVANQLTGGSEV